MVVCDNIPPTSHTPSIPALSLSSSEPVRHVHGAARADAGPLGQLPHPDPVGARGAHRRLQLRARLQRGRLVQARAEQGRRTFHTWGHFWSFLFLILCSLMKRELTFCTGCAIWSGSSWVGLTLILAVVASVWFCLG